MFIRLYDAKTGVDMLLNLREILVVKDYRADNPDRQIEGARAVVMTRPLNDDSETTHNYFVGETVTEVEKLITDAIELSY